MKALWVTNVIIGEMCERAGVPSPTSGGWMEALLDGFQRETGDSVVVLSTWDGPAASLATEEATYRLLSCGDASRFAVSNQAHRGQIRQVIDDERPDVIHIWGTEYPFALGVLESAPSVPAVVFVQGILETIARYYEGGLSRAELWRAISLQDVLRRNWILRQKRRFALSARQEKALIRRCKHVISENSWVDAHCRAIEPEVQIHQCALAVRPEFSRVPWTWSQREPGTIMCNAAGYPLKGLHMLLRALRLVADRIPDVRLMVPGGDMTPPEGLRSRLHQGGYARFIRGLVKELGLEDNVVFLGSLDPTQIAEAMRRSSAFVVPSAIENQSSSLKEAMTIGVPCVASFVGGIPDYVVHGENGLLYRFEEYEMLAEHIVSVLTDRALAERLSEGARRTASQVGDLNEIQRRTHEIYQEVIGAATAAYPAG